MPTGAGSFPDYEVLLCNVRMHLVHRLARTLVPEMVSVVLWVLGFHDRLVCRLEWLTFEPNTRVFAHSSHLPANPVLLVLCRAPEAGAGSLVPEY